MTHKDFSTIQRMLGFIDGAIFALDKSVSCGILDAIAVIGATLEKEMRTDGGDDQVRHGRWQYNTKFYVWCCSECGENPYKGTGVVVSEENLPAYCPHCGAKMDGAE